MAVNCIRCQHSLIDREGRCKQEIRQGPFSNRFWFCGCRCQFPNEAPPVKSPSYTLKEIEVLAWEFVNGNDASADQNAPDAIKLRMFMGAFIAWLARREREGRG